MSTIVGVTEPFQVIKTVMTLKALNAVVSDVPICIFTLCVFPSPDVWLLSLHILSFPSPHSSDPASHFRPWRQLLRQLWLQLRRRGHCRPHEDEVPQSQSTQGQTPPAPQRHPQRRPQPRPQPQPLWQSCTGQSERAPHQGWSQIRHHSWEWVRRASSRGQQQPGVHSCWERPKPSGFRSVMHQVLLLSQVT